MDKQGELIKHRDLWKQSDLVDSPEIKLGNSIDPNQIQEALNTSLGLKADASSAAGLSTENDQAKTKLIVFEPQTGFVFERVTEFPAPVSKSTLTQAVGPSKIVALSVLFTPATFPDDLDDDSRDPDAVKKEGKSLLTESKMTLPTQHHSTQVTQPAVNMTIAIPETATFLHLVKVVIKYHNKNNAGNPIKEIPEAYIVSFENQPQYVYSPKHIISKFISQTSFVISEDPKYIKSKQTGKKNFRQLKIKLPTGQGAKTINIEGTAKSQHILTEVCSKAKLDHTEFLLLWNGKPLNREMTVEDVWNEGGREAHLEVVERVQNMEDIPSSTGGDIFWYKKLAQKYTRYNVLYFNKKGLKSKVQEVVLGIDGEHITQSVIRKKGAQKQSEPRPIKDVLGCAVLAEGSTKFYIEYADRTLHTYDSHADMDVTKEIIGKINFLMKEK